MQIITFTSQFLNHFRFYVLVLGDIDNDIPNTDIYLLYVVTAKTVSKYRFIIHSQYLN